MKFYTIGYGGRVPHQLVSLLTERGIKAVIDVRLRPNRSSMGAYAKAKEPARGIQGLLTKAGIQYFSVVELGNIFLETEDWAERYRRLIERAGDLLTERLKQVPEPFCLLCAEKRVAECHRRVIAEFLLAGGAEVEHIE